MLADITAFVKSLPASDTPLFLMGHSMGGQEVLIWASQAPIETRKRIRGYVVEAPFVQLHPSSKPYKATVIAGRMASKVLPKRQMMSKLDPKWISRDEKVAKEWLEDPLCHDTGTLEGLAGMLSRADDLEKGKYDLKDRAGEEISIWVGHGDEDHVVSFDACKAYFDRMDVKDKEFKRYQGWYHKLHAEPGDDKIQCANDIADWMLSRAQTPPDSGAASKSRL